MFSGHLNLLLNSHLSPKYKHSKSITGYRPSSINQFPQILKSDKVRRENLKTQLKVLIRTKLNK